MTYQRSELNTLTADYEYSRSNKENLQLPIQMQLSKKPKAFCNFIAFLESTLNSEYFAKNSPGSLSVYLFSLLSRCLNSQRLYSVLYAVDERVKHC